MRVRLEPLGEELECGPNETVLDAAFRQGYNLAYGCREGQCSACKCFLLEGEAALRPYSTFALSESEQSNGYSLMCRAMPEQDLVIELLHYDPENYRLEHAIRDGAGVVEAIEPLTADIVRLLLRAEDGFEFTAGQYVDLHVPGASDGARRSFSMANLPGEGLIELVIKRYPGGRLSGMLDGQIAVGDRLSFTGPYGALRCHGGKRPILMIAGGSGMAPIVSLLRQFSLDGERRPVRFFYGARSERDLFWVDEISALGSGLADFEFTPVVERFVHEAVDEYLGGGALRDPDVYMCGPPPMVEAAQAMLERRGVGEQQIFVDKFTTSADASAPAPSAPVGEPAGVTSDDEREFTWYAPSGRRRTIYEDVTIDTQPSVRRHLTRGWPLSFEDGRGTWDENSTALRCSDWFAFRDPAEQWERPFYQGGAALEREIQDAVSFIDEVDSEWLEWLRRELQVCAFLEHGLWFALATIGRDCLSDSVATCVCLQAAMKQRSAQAIVLYAMDLDARFGGFAVEQARDRFLGDERWQPTRRYLERLAATADWGEVVVATNLVFEPLLGSPLRRELGMRQAARHGDVVTPVLARAGEREWQWAREWTIALVRMLVGDDPSNRETISQWVADWEPRAAEAVQTIAPDHSRRRVERFWEHQTPEEPVRRERRVRVPARRASAEHDGHDSVGIVMAKSAEGDAVASILGARDGIEVLEQPSFWDIRARGRLAISYEEVSQQLGYEIDAYSIQHEMSTHYGRMVATDDALMLFSDPTEAMEYLMS
ncbi:MAG: MmoB/DmpM family protein [Solirubrobacterales bacterium]|nr:MmoB/DmpM family protein [Solirubrobacterales bacterium]